ncbi:MAG: dihydrofolate reductase [Betaproteobacteria bacterium]|nr:dihydrofolate reductase [Betaproteobacteria bacterium]
MKHDIAIIAALASNRVIGKQGALPWHLPEDLKRFKVLTTGRPVIMGRKTHESILKSLGKPLPNRRSIVVTRSANYTAIGCEVVSSLAMGMALVGGQQSFVIGGAEIYSLALALADSLFLTEIDAAFDGDAWFPEYDKSEWTEAARENRVSAAQLAYSFVHYRRIPKRNENPDPEKRG